MELGRAGWRWVHGLVIPINDFLFTSFQQKNEIKKGRYSNGICFNDLFDVVIYKLMFQKEI